MWLVDQLQGRQPSSLAEEVVAGTDNEIGGGAGARANQTSMLRMTSRRKFHGIFDERPKSDVCL